MILVLTSSIFEHYLTDEHIAHKLRLYKRLGISPFHRADEYVKLSFVNMESMKFVAFDTETEQLSNILEVEDFR